jgi:electron transport complex protein RnfB
MLGTRWQIDPFKCTQCGYCATKCVKTPSAVKCVHDLNLCHYCRICMGYLEPKAQEGEPNSGAELELCPTGAITRRFTKVYPYFEYKINEDLCIACAKCVKGCTAFGQASFYLQILPSLCVNCNQCAIAQACPSQAILRVPDARPYLPKPNPHAET